MGRERERKEREERDGQISFNRKQGLQLLLARRAVCRSIAEKTLQVLWRRGNES